MFGFDGHTWTRQTLCLTIIWPFPVNHHSPTAPYSFIHYHGIDKGPLMANALQRHNTCSPAWRLSNQPDQLQYIAAGELASLTRTACFPWLCRRFKQQICLSVCSVVTRKNSVTKQHVKIHLINEAVLIIKFVDVSQKLALSNFCSISTRRHIPALNVYRHRRQYITSHTVLISYVLTDKTSYPPKWHLHTVLSSKYRDVFLQC
jgi:hypothetical protein